MQAVKKLSIEGAESEGVRNGIDFLREVSQSAISGKPFAGKKIVVIGGGDVALDTARSAVRFGADRVDLVCLESRDEMPAHDKEVMEAEAEGITIHPSLGPAKILSQDGRVTGLETKRCTTVFDEQGRFRPTFDEDVRESFEADEVIVAIGQTSDLSFLEDSGDDLVSGDLIRTGTNCMETSVEGVFAAGDVVSGPASVVDAIASGKKAAMAMDVFLGGDGIIDLDIEPGSEGEKAGIRVGFAELPRVPVPCLDPEKRIEGFEAVETGYEIESAVDEALRCLGCDLRLKLSEIVLPPDMWLEFSETNIDTVPETEGVYQLLDDKKEVLGIVGTQDLRGSLREIIQTDTNARYFLFEEDPMYTKRESELIQQYLQEHGKMPGGGDDDLDDLF